MKATEAAGPELLLRSLESAFSPTQQARWGPGGAGRDVLGMKL